MNSDELPDAKLQELAQRLGTGAAERLDVERAAQGVLARLRAEPRAGSAARFWLQPAWLRIAAVLVALLGTAVVLRGPRREEARAAAVLIPIGEDLTGLSPDQLRDAIDAVDQPLADDAPLLGSMEAGLDGLTADDLRALLRALEG